MDHGTYTQHNGKPAVRFERTFGHPVERVWAAVSEPKELAHWFPSSVELEQRTGGKITFSGDPNIETTTGTILTYDPPRRLSYTWYGDELHIELEPIGPNRCRFVMINILEASDTAARNAAGWTVCIAELDKHLHGVQSDGPARLVGRTMAADLRRVRRRRHAPRRAHPQGLTQGQVHPSPWARRLAERLTHQPIRVTLRS